MSERVYKIEGKDEEFNGLGRMLIHYENNRIDPALKSIGRCITEEEYKKLPDKQEEEEEKGLLNAEYIRMLKEVKKAKEAAEAAEQQRQRDLQEAEDRRKRDLQEAKEQNQQELQAALQAAEDQKQQELRDARRDVRVQCIIL